MKTRHEEAVLSLKEDRIICTHLKNHYAWILENFDAERARLDAEIAVIKEKKDTVLRKYTEAPQQLISLGRQLEEIAVKEATAKKKPMDTAKLKIRIEKLRKRLEDLEGN